MDIIPLHEVNSSKAAESGFDSQLKKKVLSPPIRADGLKIFALNRKDGLSVAE
jgi:hypothetical protein